MVLYFLRHNLRLAEGVRRGAGEAALRNMTGVVTSSLAWISPPRGREAATGDEDEEGKEEMLDVVVQYYSS